MLFWLSFADGDKPRGEQFLGVAVVEADGDDLKEQMSDALSIAWELGINPGGSVQGMPIPRDSIPPDCINRLLLKNELFERQIGESTRV